MAVERRENSVGRFLFANGINIVTLATVAFSAGLVVQRVDAMEKAMAVLIPKMSAIEIQQARMDARQERMSVDIRNGAHR